MFFNMRRGGDSEFFQVPKPIIMGREFRIFLNSRPYMRGGVYVLSHLALPRPTAVSLQGELGAYMVETEE